MRGDVLLYHDHDPISRLIQWRTHGPYNHVAIDLGNDSIGESMLVEATIHGVTISGGYGSPHLVSLPPSSVKEEAILWLLKQVGTIYGWGDILDDILPSWLTWRPLISERNAYDCSHLVALYLDRAEILPLAELGGDAKTVTPNDLARAFAKRGWM